MLRSTVLAALYFMVVLVSSGWAQTGTSAAEPARTSRRQEVIGRDRLPAFAGLTRGLRITLPRPGQPGLQGTVQRVERRRGQAWSVGGRVMGSARGTFFITEDADGPRGLVLMPDEDLAYALSAHPSGNVLLEERALTEVMCIDFTRPAGDAPAAESDLPGVDPPPSRQSRAGAVAVVYLDLDGELVTSSSWNGGEPITAASPGFSDNRAIAIWERVAEDFRPFDINVTTDLQVYLSAPENRRVRCIITPSGSWYGSAGGVAYVGSFGWQGDTPCWVFNTGEKSAAEAASHEVGHTLGLGHDGQEPDTEYYSGHGSGDTGWAPIMGTGYSRNLVQWSKGEYLNANRTQDDLRIITTENGFAYRRDDHGANQASATPLSVTAGGSIRAEGVIERTTDTDAFILRSRGGAADIQVDPFTRAPNLDILAELYDEADSLVAAANPVNELDAGLSVTLAPGFYVLEISGTGKGDPLGTGYSDYGCLGPYTVSGAIASATPDQVYSVPENAPAPRTIGVLPPVANPNQDPLVYTVTHGNPGNAFSADAGGTLSLSDGSLLDYEQNPVFDLLIRVDNVLEAGLSTSLYVRVEVTDINEPPVLAQAEYRIDLVENPPVDTLLATVRADDAEGAVVYSLASGNEDGGVSLDSTTGRLRVANPAVLFANLHPQLDLAVVAADTGSPSLTATGSVQITLWHELVPERSPVRVRVPTGNAEDSTWSRVEFVDDHWMEGVSGVGYDREATYDSLLNVDVESGMYNNNQTVYIRVPFRAEDPAAFDQLRLRIKYDDGFVAYVNGAEAARRNAPASIAWNSAASSLHSDSEALDYETVDLSAVRPRLRPGDNLLAVHGLNAGLTSSDALFLPVLHATYATSTGVLPPEILTQTVTDVTDASARLHLVLRAGGEAPTVRLFWGETDGGTHESAWAHVVDLGTQAASATHVLTGLAPSTAYAFRFAASNQAGSVWADESGSWLSPEPPLALIKPTSIGLVIVPTDDSAGVLWRDIAFDDSAWQRQRIAIGYERSSGYERLFYTNLESDMYGSNETAYVRAQFQLSDVPELHALILKMKYDDAFVAYLNGQEVARSANAPDDLTWNSGATGTHDDEEAVVDEVHDLTAYANLLRTGTNLLAIHGLNRNTTSSDFLIAPTLEAVPVAVLPLTYGRWVAEFGLTGAQAHPDLDADGDTWSNAQEYVLGGNPALSDAAAFAPTIRLSLGQIEYAFVRRTDYVTLGIDYRVEACVDLNSPSWVPVTGAMSGTPVMRADGLTEQVMYRYPFTDPATHLRLRITLP